MDSDKFSFEEFNKSVHIYFLLDALITEYYLNML